MQIKNVKGDIFGGLTAAVVALPLALAFGVASGLGPIAGLYGAIATGFFAAVFGGTPSQVSGPTGPMTVVMATIVAAHAENLPEAFFIVIVTGVLQIIFGVARLGRYIVYTPYSVISGFMSGIGVIIILIQLLPVIGLPAANGGPVGAISILAGTGPDTINWQAAGLALLALGISIYWPGALKRIIPPPLAALVIGTVAALIFVPDVPAIGAVPMGLPSINLPGIEWKNAAILLQAAFILALLGAIDSLLTSLVADSITRTRHNSNQELIGQGIGNIAAGLIGGLPGAGATMRTVINIRAGGRTQLSGAIHAVSLLALVLGLAPLAAGIPLAVLAGILLKVGWDIIDWSYVKRLRHAPREKVVVMLVTLGLTVFVDLITAVAVGLILALFVTARRMEAEQLKSIIQYGMDSDISDLTEQEQALLQEGGGRISMTRMCGSFSFASARELTQRLGSESANPSIFIYDFADAGYIDPSAAVALRDLFEQTSRAEQTVIISGTGGLAKTALEALGAMDKIRPENRFAERSDALGYAVKTLRDKT